MTDRPLTREAAGIALRRLAASIAEEDHEAAAGRLLERVAASSPELREALVEVGARAAIAEARRGVAVAQGSTVALSLAETECRPCPRCGLCLTCDLGVRLGHGHECRR